MIIRPVNDPSLPRTAAAGKTPEPLPTAGDVTPPARPPAPAPDRRRFLRTPARPPVRE